MVLRRSVTASLSKSTGNKVEGSSEIFSSKPSCSHCPSDGPPKKMYCQVFRSSLFAKAFGISLVPATISAFLKWQLSVAPEFLPSGLFPKESQPYTSFVWVLGLILVFRLGQAYNRFWQGATGVTKMGMEWFHACSQITAYAEASGAPRTQIHSFKVAIVRLFSLLHSQGLLLISERKDADIHVIDPLAYPEECVRYLRFRKTKRQRVEIVVQWIQAAVLEALDTKVLIIPSPILTRAFQELEHGLVNMADLMTISETPFPIPYAEFVFALLVVHLVLTPFFVLGLTEHWAWSGLFAFTSVFTMWVIHFIAKDIENPFGDDLDDLDLPEAQRNMNSSLLTLLETESQIAPNMHIVEPEAAHGFKNRTGSLGVLSMSTILTDDHQAPFHLNGAGGDYPLPRSNTGNLSIRSLAGTNKSGFESPSDVRSFSKCDAISEGSPRSNESEKRLSHRASTAPLQSVIDSKPNMFSSCQTTLLALQRCQTTQNSKLQSQAAAIQADDGWDHWIGRGDREASGMRNGVIEPSAEESGHVSCRRDSQNLAQKGSKSSNGSWNRKGSKTSTASQEENDWDRWVGRGDREASGMSNNEVIKHPSAQESGHVSWRRESSKGSKSLDSKTSNGSESRKGSKSSIVEPTKIDKDIEAGAADDPDACPAIHTEADMSNGLASCPRRSSEPNQSKRLRMLQQSMTLLQSLHENQLGAMGLGIHDLGNSLPFTSCHTLPPSPASLLLPNTCLLPGPQREEARPFTEQSAQDLSSVASIYKGSSSHNPLPRNGKDANLKSALEVAALPPSPVEA